MNIPTKQTDSRIEGRTIHATSFKMGVGACGAVALVSLIPFAGTFVLAPIVALVMAVAAGRRTAAATTTRPANDAARAGALVGTGALVGSIIGMMLLVLVVVTIPGVQEFIRTSEPHPEARLPYAWIAPVGALAGLIVGFFAGLFDLCLALAGGFLAGWVYTHNCAVLA